MILNTDVLTLIKITRTDDGVETRTTTTGIPCRVEDGNETVVDPRGGQMVRQGMLILVGPTFTGVKGDLIIVTKTRGTSPATAEYQIQKVEACGAFKVSHFEVYT